ncbi:hypothetical protein [Mycobacterium sp. 1274756.6]|uniref:hypothetical protein n=1 Tax=Mycobacterium sp. 1274756.6 TaxID=1834076 RepID=UPI0007FD3AC6|nr:hypothetical protein [Mycobacterium sp. 1274756.6]OBJ72163.1 hypothetical protein A5643_06075 [Mycobacterium sp. 1274756.6]
MNDAPADRAAQRRRRQWGWLVAVTTALAVAGSAVALVLMLPLAMATDPCHGDDTEWVCQLSARGQNLLVLLPWLAVGGGLAGAAAGAALAAWRRWNPLIGIAVGVLGYVVVVPIGYELALRV